MDTVEELNGTYFYAGRSNLTASELFSWSLSSILPISLVSKMSFLSMLFMLV